MIRSPLTGLALLLPLVFSGVAAAQQSGSEGFGLIQLGGDGAGSFPGDRFRPAIDRQGILDVESGAVGEHLDYDLGVWFDYSHNNLVLYRFNAADDPSRSPRREFSLLEHRFSAHLTGAINLFDWVELGFDVPFVPFQYRSPVPDTFTAGAPFWTVGGFGEFSSGIGDVRLVPKIRILKAEDQFVDLAIIPNITLPTAFPWGLYLGEGFFTFVPEIALSREIFGLRLGTNVGYRARFIARMANQKVGHEVTYRFGLGYKFHELTQVPLSVDWTVSGAVGVWPLIDNYNQAPLETHAQVTYDIIDRLQVFGGLGGGIIGGPGTPEVRLFAGTRYAPRVRDADGDGKKDNEDVCPDDPEDKDGFEDSDGCPDPDNDQDGILDRDDRCPDEQEDVDQFEDEDGCPEVDNDQDGVLDADDRCPNEPEDKDGFNDSDGCLDPDNDEDGILDAQDKCPLEPGVPQEQGCPMGDTDRDGIADDRDQCPTDPEDKDGFEDADGCPDLDNDKDMVLDADDKCPMEAEDKDGFEDLDGCPEVDNDKDGIPDKDDQCPLKPETINGRKDDDGCPDRGKTKVRMTETKIEILERVYFDTGKASIKSRSFNLLGQVAAVMKANPEVTKIRIEGHTDSQGDDAYNKKLSEDRAQSVRQFIIDQGINPGRVVAQGFGEERPVADNADRAGRAQNRRVEFKIVEIGGRPVEGEATIRRMERERPDDQPPEKTTAPPGKKPPTPAPPRPGPKAVSPTGG